MNSAPSCKMAGHGAVQHTYHDYSHDADNAKLPHPTRRGSYAPFLLKLHKMLASAESDGFEHIVSWQPHGRCFVVHKPYLFVSVLSHHFRLSKVASFSRQLNLYGFQRLTQGRDRGGYYNEFFLRNKAWLTVNIHRQRIKGTGVRSRSNPDDEPDFWHMPWVSSAEYNVTTSAIGPPFQLSSHQSNEHQADSMTSSARKSTGMSSKTTVFAIPHLEEIIRPIGINAIPEQSSNHHEAIQSLCIDLQGFDEQLRGGDFGPSFSDFRESCEIEDYRPRGDGVVGGLLEFVPRSSEQDLLDEDLLGTMQASVRMVSISASLVSSTEPDGIEQAVSFSEISQDETATSDEKVRPCQNTLFKVGDNEIADRASKSGALDGDALDALEYASDSMIEEESFVSVDTVCRGGVRQTGGGSDEECDIVGREFTFDEDFF